jgi:hypothetical protein
VFRKVERTLFHYAHQLKCRSCFSPANWQPPRILPCGYRRLKYRQRYLLHSSGAKFRLLKGVRKICSSCLNCREKLEWAASFQNLVPCQRMKMGEGLRWRILFECDIARSGGTKFAETKNEWFEKSRVNTIVSYPDTNTTVRREFLQEGPTVSAACCRDVVERLLSMNRVYQ